MNYFDRKLLFSMEGRINRRPYFFAGLLVACFSEASKLIPDAFMIFYLPVVLAALWAAVALGIKRCHDRGRTGWFMLLNVVPIVCLWPIIELTFFKGTDGPNQYGPDPLGGEAPAPAAAPAA